MPGVKGPKQKVKQDKTETGSEKFQGIKRPKTEGKTEDKTEIASEK